MSGVATVESAVVLQLVALRLLQEGCISGAERDFYRLRAEKGEPAGVLLREMWGREARAGVA